MYRNNFLRCSLLILAVSIMGLSCRKDDFTPVNLDNLNTDIPLQNTELDEWLKTTFLDEYNVEVSYRYNRYLHEADRNVAPVKPEMVKPMMTTVLEGYIQPYRDIAGETFIKKYIPKQWVLFGSTSYDGSNIGYAGTASGGVRINLFGLNYFSLTPAFVTGRLQVIHHEFTHILNQIVPIPTDFPLITASTYNGSWKDTHPDSAHNWGYVSAYASGSYMEDYAETNSAMLVYGPSWFDYYVKTSGTDAGKAALRLKEQNVVGYFNEALNVDYRKLQKEVQTYIRDVLKDPQVTFPYWINKGLYTAVNVQLDDELHINYGKSTKFSQAYDTLKTKVSKKYTAVYKMESLQFMPKGNKMIVRMPFTATQGDQSGTTFNGDFAFNMSLNPNTGETIFEKAPQGDGTDNSGPTFNNGNIFLPEFEKTIQQFLTESTYIADWLPAQTPAELYTKTGGFYQKDNPSNYFYGSLVE